MNVEGGIHLVTGPLLRRRGSFRESTVQNPSGGAAPAEVWASIACSPMPYIIPLGERDNNISIH